MIKKLMSLLLIFLMATLSFAENIYLDSSDVKKYNICTSAWIDQIDNEKCDISITEDPVFDRDYLNQFSHRYLRFDDNSELLITSKLSASGTQEVLRIVEYSPLKSYLTNFDNEFYGSFYHYDEDLRVNSDWHVKCDSAKRACIVSDGIVSIAVDKSVKKVFINPNLSISEVEFFDSSLTNSVITNYSDINQLNNSIQYEDILAHNKMLIVKSIKNRKYKEQYSLVGVGRAVGYAEWAIKKMK